MIMPYLVYDDKYGELSRKCQKQSMTLKWMVKSISDEEEASDDEHKLDLPSVNEVKCGNKNL